jgi:hypothetical protein
MPRATAPSTVVDVILAEPSEAVSDLAERLMHSAAKHSPIPVMHARVRVIRHTDPAVAQAVVAKAVLAMPLQQLRAEATGETEQEALERLHDRVAAQLDRRVQRSSGSWEARRARLASGEPHEWRHGDRPTPRAPYFVRPPEQRQVILHSSMSPEICDVDEAAEDMVAMDYWFHLFTEAGSGQDSLLTRTDGVQDEYRLAQVEPMPDRLAPHLLPMTIVEQPAPLLSVPEAVEQLELEGEPLLFFLDADKVCGAVIYHRFDGHYGLVIPARHGA